jgi:hypothetical protein
MTTPTNTPKITCGKARDTRGWETCIHALAAGWILADDLCPVCTQTFMAALDVSVPGLVWHPTFRDRAGLSGPSLSGGTPR